jgi:circadian clock protein KaiC
VQYVRTAAERGERAVMYQFDERRGTLLTRAAKLGMDLAPHLDSGRVSVRQIDPASLSPGEFARLVRSEVEAPDPARLVVVDSLNGYLLAMPQEKQLVLHLRELISFLNQRGTATFLVNPQQGLLGSMQSKLDLSYIADTVLLLRFFEAEGRVRKALSVIKNRGGAHEDTIRELRISARGVQIGEPLTAFRGVFSGTPSYRGSADPLLGGDEDGRGPAGG